MKKAEIQKLNENIEKLNSNLEKLISLVSASSGVDVQELTQSIPLLLVSNPVLESHPVKKSTPNALVGVDVNEEAHGVKVVSIREEYTGYSSSCFNKVRFNPKTKELTVFFKSNNPNKATYTYSNFGVRAYNKFIKSQSLGSYYQENIKGIYPCQKN